MSWLQRLRNSFGRSYARSTPALVAGSSLEGFPETAFPPPGESLDRDRLIFDPALKEFRNAFRSKAPSGLDAAQAEAFHEAAGRSMAHLLELIANSPLSEHLVLRGSSSMPFWVGDLARTPKDLDFVVRPISAEVDGAVSRRIFEEIPSLLESDPCPGLEAKGRPLVSPIWTYDRVPGRRLVLHWQAEGEMWGATQLDFVFGETLFEDPRHVDGLNIGVCGPTVSLAWKLSWLASDIHPQAKDLYDAMVLAEAYPPSEVDAGLIRKVILSLLHHGAPRWSDIARRSMEWVGFDQMDDAGRQDLAREWFARLEAALPAWSDLTA